MLDVRSVDFDYQDQPLIQNITFNLPAGGLIHLKGANGCGKTTLLKLIAGLYQPINGHIYFDGKPIALDLRAYQRQLCFVGHKAGINPSLTVRENCRFDLHALPEIDLDELAKIFKLQRQLNQPAGLLSAGQRRQVGLLRLWMSSSRLWLLDEPLVALDESALMVIMAKIAAHREQGGAVLVTSHQTLPLNHSDYQEYLL